MTNRLVVNAGTPQAWEILLRPGANRIGRGEHNDFIIPHPSVSGSHCEITVGPTGVLLKDLGSTNGTFIDGGKVAESNLLPGHQVRFGQVDLVFEAGSIAMHAMEGTPATRMVSPPIAPTPAPPIGAAATPARPAPPAIRIHKPAVNIERPAVPGAPVAGAEAAPPFVPVPTQGPGEMPARDMGVQFCRSHKTIHAHFHCDRCQKSFCDLCVNTKQEGDHLSHTCRACGSECVTLLLKKPKAAPKKAFVTMLPGALIYPLRGTGILIILVSGLLFAALEYLANPFGFGILFIIAVLGYLFSYSQNIIHATAAEEKDMPEMPGFDDLFGGCMRLLTCVGISFGLPLILAIANAQNDLGVPGPVILGLVGLGGLYFPMCFLAVAMKDTVAAANPMFVIPSILKVPLEYLIAAVCFLSVLGMYVLGKVIALVVGSLTTSTRDMSALFIFLGFRLVWTFVSVYLLTVSTRVLGLLYVSKKHKLGWFPR